MLKTVSIANSNYVKRFRREATAVAKLKHPNIIRILDTSGNEESFFIAMEFIPGGTVRDQLETGPLSRNEAMHITRNIGAALTYAHQQGIIHRDVNPNNILLDTTEDMVRPVLSDFGLIKVLAGDDYTQTQSNTILGTIDYMAPEQWKQKIPTPATDVYALALTFFEMMSGQRPFASNSPLELMDKHASEPLPPLSSVAPGVGPFFDEVLLKAAAKDPSDRFNTVADFIEALEIANGQAEETERSEKEDKAAKVVEAARSYVQGVRYDSDRALAMVEAALEICAGYPDALRLRGSIRLQQGEIEKALEDYKQGYEQVGDPASDVGVEYLQTLSQTAESFWQGQMYRDAVKHYEAIKDILSDKDYEAEPVREFWQMARTRLIEYHCRAGEAAYDTAAPENINESIHTLDRGIKLLQALKADSEYHDLREKRRLLQVRKYQSIIHDVEASIREIDTQDSKIRVSDETIFQHYLTIDEAYQALIELEPGNNEWPEQRREKLRDQSKRRCLFAIRASRRLEPDYEAALRHYKALLDIEQTKYPGIAQELDIDLNERITALQKKADHDGKYNEIQKLIADGDLLKALERLDQEFIQEGNYEHRDVIRLFWGLIYAKQHEGAFPPEWESLSGFQSLSNRLVRTERMQIQQLKDKLEPWSQSKILKTVDQGNKTLGTCEDEITSIEALTQRGCGAWCGRAT